MGLLDRFKAGLKRTRELLFTDVRDLFKTGEILARTASNSSSDAQLIATDMGVAAAESIRDEIRKQHMAASST